MLTLYFSPGSSSMAVHIALHEVGAAFEARPFSRYAVSVRRWDDQAKDPAVTAPRFAHFAPLLRALIRS